jgi:hypothetical protein
LPLSYFIKLYALKEYVESVDPSFLDIGTSWRFVVSFTLRQIYSKLERSLGGPQI